jgi:hypothetical protein
VKYILTILLLASCQSREVAGDQNATTIATQSGLIDGEANTIMAKFPKAKPHTDKIKESTPIIREANDAQQEKIIRLSNLVQELQAKETTRFKWVVCIGLFIFGGISAYFGINKLGSKFTTLGLSMAGGSVSLFYYWEYVEKYSIPALIVYAIITGIMARKEKDDIAIGKTVKPTVT